MRSDVSRLHIFFRLVSQCDSLLLYQSTAHKSNKDYFQIRINENMRIRKGKSKSHSWQRAKPLLVQQPVSDKERYRINQADHEHYLVKIQYTG